MRDWVGRPVRRVALSRASHEFGSLLRSAQRRGICAVTRSSQIYAVVLSYKFYVSVLQGAKLEPVLAEVRRHDPGGVYSGAKRLLGSAEKAEHWLSTEFRIIGGRRSIDCLHSPQGTKAVLDLLNQIEDGTLL